MYSEKSKVDDFLEKYKTIAEKKKALKAMSEEEWKELVNATPNRQALIGWSGLRKE